jgi:thiamine pyridinylase
MRADQHRHHFFFALATLVCVLVISTACLTASAEDASHRRTLKVVVYPFVPDHIGLFYDVKSQFEAKYPDIDLQIFDLSNNYYDSTSPGAITNTAADVYEVDTVFLQDLAAQNQIQPLPKELIPVENRYFSVANLASQYKKTWYGVPHWVCSNFLFFKKDDPLAKAKTLMDIENSIGIQHDPGKGLLIDMKGKTTLGELYVNALIDKYGSVEAAEKFLTPDNLDDSCVAALKRVIVLCDKGYGRDSDYHNVDGFYPRQFAWQRGRAMVGYTEAMSATLSETINACPKEIRINSSDIGVAPLSLSDKDAVPFAWVDSFCIAKTCKGQRLKDAAEFIRFMSDVAQVRNAVTAPTATQPRYLAPALKELFTDGIVLMRCPLYKYEADTFAKAVPVTGLNLENRLRAIGKKIDGLLGP